MFNGKLDRSRLSLVTPLRLPSDMDLFGSDSAPSFGMSDVGVESPFGSNYSPAIPTSYDFSEQSFDGTSSHMGTVSPQDLMRDPIMSAPNSAAYTNLTTPSMYNESPDFAVNEYDNSPLFGAPAEAADSDPWFSLFPESETKTQSVEIEQLDTADRKEVAAALKDVNTAARARSDTPAGRHSSTSGISRKRAKVLAPIAVDPEDTVAMKRARNTMAARKSREKKMQRFDELEEEIAQLKKERDHWKSMALQRNPGASV